MPDPDIPPELGALLASLSEQSPSNDPAAVVRAALGARPALPLQPVPGGDEVGAFGRAVDDVRRTLGLLSDAQWTLPAVNRLTVGELVGHLIGVQHLTAAELGLENRLPDSEYHANGHIEMTRRHIDAAAVGTAAAAAEEFARVSRTVTTHLARLDANGLAASARFGVATADVRFMLIGRVFELWTHDNDLRAATGLPRVDPDRERLWMMTRTAMPLVRLVGDPRLRLVLTGAGGGVWAAEGTEVGEVVADAAAFCRRLANRITVEELHADISGDLAVARHTLDAIAGLALD